MLANYDAKSVAEVLGIAFLRSLEPGRASEGEPVLTGRKAVARRDREDDFVICVDDRQVLVVQAQPDDVSPPGKPGRRGSRLDMAADLISPPSPVLIEKAVERGLPRHALRRVAEHLAGGDNAAASLLEWGVVSKTTLDRRTTQLSPLESERTERVARLFVHARRALGTEAEARDFMTTPHPQLEGRSPVMAARTDFGARRTEQLLNALEYGLAL